jgi:5'-nucleotidase (lipoprotein e(P4) family)
MDAMRRYPNAFALIAVCAAATLATSLDTPADAIPAVDVKPPIPKFTDYGNQVGIAFSKTADYSKEFDAAIADAYKACKEKLADVKAGKKLAVVSDVDETLLDNRPFFEKHTKFDWPAFTAWINKAEAPTLPKTAKFLSWAKDNGFSVFLVTGRHEGMRKGTEANLKNRNVKYDELMMRAATSNLKAEAVKVPLREQVEKKGYTIVVNIGDQWSDLTGGHAMDCEKLPNKIYFVP